MRYFSLLIFLVLIVACHSPKENIPTGIIPPKQMELILWDYLKADAYAAEFLKKRSGVDDSLENMKFQQTIFEHYKITRQDFYKSYQFYCKNPKMLSDIMDSINAHQQSRLPYQIPINKLPKDEKSF